MLKLSARIFSSSSSLSLSSLSSLSSSFSSCRYTNRPELYVASLSLSSIECLFLNTSWIHLVSQSVSQPAIRRWSYKCKSLVCSPLRRHRVCFCRQKRVGTLQCHDMYVSFAACNSHVCVCVGLSVVCPGFYSMSAMGRNVFVWSTTCDLESFSKCS